MNQAALELLIQLKDEASAGIAGIGDALSSIGGMAVAGVAVAGAAIGGFLVNAVSEAAEAQDNFAQLEAVIKSTGGAAGVTADEVAGMASALQQTTKFSDDAILKGQSLLLTFTGIGKDVFPDVTKTMLDMSQAMGTDLKGTAMQLGKALNDPIKGMAALSRSGVVFSAEQKAMITSMQEAGDVAGAQRVMLAELQKEFGGSAEAAGKTFSGQLAIAKNMLGEFGEMIGGKILPILTPLIGSFIKFATDALPQVEAAVTNTLNSFEWLFSAIRVVAILLGKGDLEGAFNTIAGAILDLFGVARGADDEFVGPFAGAANLFMEIFATIGEVIENIGRALGQGKGLAGVIEYVVGTILMHFGMFEDEAFTVGEQVAGAFSKIASDIQTTIGFVVATILPLLEQGFNNIVSIVQVVIASVIENWPKIQATIEQVINAIVTNVLPILITVIGGVQEIMQKIVNWVIENWPLISATVTRVIQAIGNVIAVVLPIIRGIFETVFPIIKGVVETAMDLVLGIIKTVMQLITGDTAGALETLKETFAGVWDKIKSAAKIVWDAIKKVVTDAVQGAIDWVNGIGDKMKNIGANIILDIVDGIKSAPRSILNALREIVDSAISDIKRVLGIHSDSTVMMEIGQHMMGGLATGFVESMQSEMPRLKAAMTQMSAQMVITPDGAKFGFTGDFGSNGQRPSFAASGNVTVNIYGATVRDDTDIDELAYAVAKRVKTLRGR